MGGIVESINVNVKEAYFILKEIKEVHTGVLFIRNICGEDPRFLLRSDLTLEHAQKLIEDWYNHKFEVLIRYNRDTIPILIKLDKK